MGDLEKAWSHARDQIFEEEKLNNLQSLSSSIEAASFKYKSFNELLENCDSDIFIAIPCLAIMKSLVSDSTQSDEASVCKRFLPSMFKEGEEPQRKLAELKSEYLKLKTRVCGSTEFIIKSNPGSSHGQRQRSHSRDATALIPNGTKATIASSLVCH